jgi:hypothetical protein
VPFEKLVEELRPPRTRSHSLLYQFKLEFRDGERESLRLGSLAVELYRFADLVARHDLHLSLIADGPCIQAQLLYDAALFEAVTIEGWLEDFRYLLECVADNDELPVSQLRERLIKLGDERRARHESEYSDVLLRLFPTAREVAAQ